MRLISTFCLTLAFVLASNAHAHIGEKIYLIFEIPDADLANINLIAMPDFDTAPQEYRGYHTLSGQAATFRFAECFVDGQLVGADDETSVADLSWARIKASFSE